MKSLKLVTLATIALVACMAVTGCKKKTQRTTPLPTTAATPGTDNTANLTGDNGNKITVPPPVTPSVEPVVAKPGDDGTYKASSRSLEGRTQDRDKFKAQTVYFDFDRFVVKASETHKADAVVAEYKKCDPECDLLIEGHCDERGTPEYNRALGERRALAIREYVIRAGLDPEHVHTISFGKDKPEALGHDEASWSKNRRGQFILVLPK